MCVCEPGTEIHFYFNRTATLKLNSGTVEQSKPTLVPLNGCEYLHDEFHTLFQS